MGIVCDIFLFCAGLIGGAMTMGLAQSKRAFETRRLREELEDRLKKTDQDWDFPECDCDLAEHYDVKIYK